MIQIVSISLENEMDLVLAHRKTMRVAEKLGLTIATQTTFATAVSEIARTVIEHTDNGNLLVGLEQTKQRYGLKAAFTFKSDTPFTNADEGYYYAQKLVPEFNLIESEGSYVIEMKMGLPRSLNLDRIKTNAIIKEFNDDEPINAYEEIKRRNVSLNKIAEEQEEELRQSKIIDEKKTEFLSVASHEIKTPITIIKAYSQIAKSGKTGCSEQVRDMLDKIDRQSSKLLLLVQQLLDVSKIENGNLLYSVEEVDLNPFLSEMVDMMKAILPNHQLQTTFKADKKVRIDRLRMEQVFSNLISNAAKYSENDTIIQIGSDENTPGFVQITIKDQGIGMSEKSMRSVFDKFYRDKDVIRTHSGLGMGLYIASKIVSDHGGHIRVESKEREGSSFMFTIPCNY